MYIIVIIQSSQPPSLPLSQPTEALCREQHQATVNVAIETEETTNEPRSSSYPGDPGMMEDALKPHHLHMLRSSSCPTEKNEPIIAQSSTHGESSGNKVGLHKEEEENRGRKRHGTREEEEVRTSGRGRFMSNIKSAFIKPRRTKSAPVTSQNIPRVTLGNNTVEFTESLAMGSSYMKVSLSDFHKDEQTTATTDMEIVEEEEKGEEGEGEREEQEFRSLLLFIPLRLGQEKFNMEYAEALKVCALTVPLSLSLCSSLPSLPPHRHVSPSHSPWGSLEEDQDMPSTLLVTTVSL